MEKMIEFSKKMNPEKIYIATDLCWHSAFKGYIAQLQKYRIFGFNSSSGSMTITNDEFFQKMKGTVITTSNLTNQETRDKIKERVKGLYPGHYSIVFVWSAGRKKYTPLKGFVAFAEFDAMENKEFGHDVLVLLT